MTNSQLLAQYRANPNKTCRRGCPAGSGHTVGFHIKRLEWLVSEDQESLTVTNTSMAGAYTRAHGHRGHCLVHNFLITPRRVALTSAIHNDIHTVDKTCG